jgi:predicted 3-demethylubiquinone-9 3-methyltransferase (glyoxalase superfamily)
MKPAPKAAWHAVFSLNGQEYMCIDSHVKHEFTFTPLHVALVNCENEPRSMRFTRNCPRWAGSAGWSTIPSVKSSPG